MTVSLFLTLTILIFTLFNGLITFFTLTENPPTIFQRMSKQCFFISIGISLCSLLMAVFGVSGVPFFQEASSLLLILAVSNVFFSICTVIKEFIPQSFSSLFAFAVKTLTVILLLENTVCNFNAYDFLRHNYVKTPLHFSQATISNGNINPDNSLTLYASGTVEFESVDIPVGSVYAEVVNEKSSSTQLKISYADETNKEYRNPIDFTIIGENPYSATTYCSFSGKVSRLLFTSNAEEIRIHSLVLNMPIVARINPVRVSVLLFFALLCYFLKKSAVCRKPIKDSNAFMQICALGLSILFVYLAFFSVMLYRGNNELTTEEEFKMTKGNQMTYELVKAFEKGQVYLDIDVDPSLTALENPYDWSLRRNQHAVYEWDNVYYNGHYYSYYGIAPVILLFVPYHQLTGYYFPTVWAVFLFGSIGIIFLVLFFFAFMKKYFADMPCGMGIGGCILLSCCSSVWFNFVTPNFYEIAQTSGFACVTAGAYFLLTCNMDTGRNISYSRLTVSSVLLALSVLCRPTLAVYCIVAVVLLVFGFFRLKDNTELTNTVRIKYFCCALLPYIIIGSVQMIYNYLRFGNVFDFGIAYSLTINDFTRAESHLSQVLIGFVNFLFVFPKLDTEFPFVHSNFTTLDVHGYYFIANTICCGLLFKALPVFSYLYSAKAYRLSHTQYRKQNTLFIALCCVAAPTVIIYSIAESGYGVRYATDFAWQLIWGALIIAFILYRYTQNGQLRNVMEKLLLISVIVGIVISFTQMYEYHFNNLQMIELREGFLSFARNFEFWK